MTIFKKYLRRRVISPAWRSVTVRKKPSKKPLNVCSHCQMILQEGPQVYKYIPRDCDCSPKKRSFYVFCKFCDWNSEEYVGKHINSEYVKHHVRKAHPHIYYSELLNATREAYDKRVKRFNFKCYGYFPKGHWGEEYDRQVDAELARMEQQYLQEKARLEDLVAHYRALATARPRPRPRPAPAPEPEPEPAPEQAHEVINTMQILNDLLNDAPPPELIDSVGILNSLLGI